MNTDIITIVSTIHRGHEIKEDDGRWPIYRKGELVCTKASKQNALAWVDKYEDAVVCKLLYRR